MVSLTSLRQSCDTYGNLAELKLRGAVALSRSLQEYNNSVSRLAASLRHPTHESMPTALLCCQTFISIEVMLSNYAAAVEHFIRGVRILHESRSRPVFDEGGNLVLPQHTDLASIDIFVIKLFLASCPQERRRLHAESDPRASEVVGEGHRRAQADPGAPYSLLTSNDIRSVLSVAGKVLDFLTRVSDISSLGQALSLLDEKQILEQLDKWRLQYQSLLPDYEVSDPRLVGLAFLDLLHSTLLVVVSLPLGASKDDTNTAEDAFNRLTAAAKYITETLDELLSHI